MKTYTVFAKCETPNCEGKVIIGMTDSESGNLIEQVQKFPAQKATCPVCRQEADYTPLNYTACLLKTPED